MYHPLLFRTRLLVAAWTGLVCVVLPQSQPLRGDGPTLKRLFPPGGQRGATVEVAALGDAPKWPVQVWCDDPGIRWEALADKAKFRVSIAADVPPGRHAVRFFDSDNSTDALRFVVGQLPELNETEPNDALDKAQVVSDLPKLVNGVLEKRGAVDAFAVELSEGQMLIAAIEAQQVLGSPVDATLQVVSPRGSVLAQNLDSVGLDPRITFVAPRAGRYCVRVFGFPETPDSTIGFAGGENYVYRLSLSHGGLLQSSRPLAVSDTGVTRLELLGVALPTGETTVQPTPAAAKRGSWPLTVEGAINMLPLPILRMPSLVEQPQQADQALQSLPIPCSITGTLARAGESDAYRLTAKKDSKLLLELHSREYGYPTDGVLAILDDDGKELTRVDDVRKEIDARTVWRAPADGKYRLVVSDAFGSGGPDWHYRVDIRTDASDAALSVKADRYQGKVGTPLEIAVTVDRREGYAQPIRISASGLPESVKCAEVVSEKDGKTAKEVTLSFSATEPFSGPIRIIGTLPAEPPIERAATAASDAFVSDLWLTIKP